MQDFQTHYGHPAWGWVEELLGARLPKNHEARKESFSLKITGSNSGCYLACPSPAEIIRLGGFLNGGIDWMDAAWMIFGGCHMDQITFVSFHQSRYNLVRRFE
ncbi:hypothetical protein PIB30_051631 [Stylosanthes scabra]|uniref:Uncharacterized protein n=1 Tax=Stylosanthes scabra TaxID=79078 RepID=A0ABU6UJX5_9FABA|nr:hypothetical protein [Stylosanthes scabra]